MQAINESYVHGQVFPNDFAKAMIYNQAISETGLKFDADKPRMDLLDSEFLEDMAGVLTFGAKKYAPHNWRKGLHISRTIAAIYRHLGAINRGEDRDPESGLLHSAHLGVNVQFLNWMLKNKPEMDDRWKP
jgi:hypothetical protein